MTWQNQQNECAPSIDSDQPGHLPSLIRVFPPVCMKKAWVHSTHWVHSEDSDQTGRMPRLIWVFAGCSLILLVLSCRGSYNESYMQMEVNVLFCFKETIICTSCFKKFVKDTEIDTCNSAIWASQTLSLCFFFHYSMKHQKFKTLISIFKSRWSS